IEDEARARHALYGFVAASDAYSTGRYVVDAAAALRDARGQGLRPIFVGGTGLYFKALLEGLSPVPPVDETVRAHWRGEADRVGAAALHAVLAVRDPQMAARLKAADTQRIVRALEVLDSSGTSLSAWQRLPGVPLLDNAKVVRLVIQPDRTDLHARTDARFDRMVADGGLAEAERLAALGLDPDLPAMRAIGVGPLISAAAGQMPVDAAITQAKAETRQYLKRQSTWLRRNMIAWNDISSQSMEISLASAIAFIQS
ncbi:MAG: tRNA (adenosine(37)-N6)-dimethylallyltransferase MiaA, partial [Hyphomicrobium sp.]